MNVALAVFAKAPLPGAVKTRLSPQLTSSESADLYRCMLLDTVQRVSCLPWDTVVFYQGDRNFFEASCPGVLLVPQVELGLGERLVAAHRGLHALGYAASVFLGSDAPDVPLRYVEEGVRRLREGADVVFGPAEDGGYYLVGVKGAECRVFEGIPWSTSGVLKASLERTAAAGLRTELLPPWYDVDSYSDLLRPGLLDSGNGAPLTRACLQKLGIGAGA